MKENCLNLAKDILKELNTKSAVFTYDLPFALLSKDFDSIEELVDSSPIAYIFYVTESPSFPGGCLLHFENVEV